MLKCTQYLHNVHIHIRKWYIKIKDATEPLPPPSLPATTTTTIKNRKREATLIWPFFRTENSSPSTTFSDNSSSMFEISAIVGHKLLVVWWVFLSLLSCPFCVALLCSAVQCSPLFDYVHYLHSIAWRRERERKACVRVSYPWTCARIRATLLSADDFIH